MPSIADTAARVAAAGVPVLFLDTCSILDVIRAPVRGLAGCVEAALELLGMATAAVPLCQLVVGSFVPKEWDDHDEAVLGELTRHLKRVDEQSDQLQTLCGHLGLGMSPTRPDYATSGLDIRLHDHSRQLLRAAVALDQDPDTNARAFERVAVSPRRPCHKGGELKDCTIFEECLEVCRRLRVVSFGRKMVFCTSNINDYCTPGTKPHPDVAADCAAVGLTFTTSLPWALSEVKS